MFDLVRQSVLGFGYFSDEQLAQLTARLRPCMLKKGERLIREGQTCRNFFFVNSGAFRQFQLLANGTEAILNLYVEMDWVFEYNSLVAQKPAMTIIDATEDSEVLALSLIDFHELAGMSEIFFRMGKIFQYGTAYRDFQSNRISPEEKYKLLLTTKPLLVQKFSLKTIASFLAMTPETLSRVRRKIIS